MKLFKKIKLFIETLLKIEGVDQRSFRNRRIIYTGLSLIGSRGINMVTLIVSLPLCLNHLGAERFGMMETVISLIMIMSFADLGLGFGLQNRLAELEKSEDKTELKKAISSTFWILIGFTSFLSLIFFIAYPNIAWDHIFNVKSELAISEAGPTVIVFFFVLSFRFHFL